MAIILPAWPESDRGHRSGSPEGIHSAQIEQISDLGAGETRTLKSKIRGMLYERTAISKKPEKLIEQDLDALQEEDKVNRGIISLLLPF